MSVVTSDKGDRCSYLLTLNFLIDDRPEIQYLFFLPKNTDIKYKTSKEETKTELTLMGYNALAFPCTSERNKLLYHIKEQQKFECRGTIANKEAFIIFSQILHSEYQ